MTKHNPNHPPHGAGRSARTWVAAGTVVLAAMLGGCGVTSGLTEKVPSETQPAPEPTTKHGPEPISAGDAIGIATAQYGGTVEGVTTAVYAGHDVWRLKMSGTKKGDIALYISKAGGEVVFLNLYVNSD